MKISEELKQISIPQKTSRPKFIKYGKWLPLVVAGLVLLLGWVIGLVRPPFVIDIGADDRQDLIYLQTGAGGFFNPEQRKDFERGAEYTANYRWTGRVAYINLPWTLDAVPLKVTLRATAPRPDRPPDAPGTVLTVTGELGNSSLTLGQFPLQGLYEGSQIVVRLPEHLRPRLDAFRLRFDSSETYQPGGGDIRALSAIFFDVKLEPDYAAFGWRGWLATFIRPLVLALLTLWVWGLTSFFTAKTNWRLTFQIVAGLLLLISLIWWPQAAETLYTAWLLILAIGWLLLILAGRFADSTPNLPRPFVYAATLLPGLPVVQFIAGRLDFTSLNPGSFAFAVYSTVLLISLAVYFGVRSRFETVFMWAMLATAVLIFGYSHWRVFEQNLYRGSDFRNYYMAVVGWQESAIPLYDLQDMAKNPGSAIRMPPAFAVLFWPLTQFFGRDNLSALTLWRIFNELLLIPTIWMFWRMFGRAIPGLKIWPAIVFVVLSFGQLAETIAYGQLNYILLFGLTLTSYFVYQKRDGLAGFALSLPIWVKLLPVVSAVFFLIERRWRGLIGLIGGAIVINLLTLLVVGWDAFWFYFTRAMWNVNDPELGITNQSWWGFMGRLAVNEVKGDFTGGYPTRLAPLGYLAALVGIALTLFSLWRARNDSWLTVQLMLGALVLVALWIPPFSWMHYIVPGLVAIVPILIFLSRKEISRPQIIIFALAYALLAYGGRQEFFFVEAVGLERLGSSYRFLATFTLWALNLWLLWQAPEKRIQESEVRRQN